IYDDFYRDKRDYACTMCVIDLVSVPTTLCNVQWYRSTLVIRYTQRPLIGFPLESKASRVKCSDRHGGTSVLVGGILQTAPRRVQNRLVAGKQIVRLPCGNKICADKMRRLLNGKEKYS
ncbi:hypothetical protein X777_05828, partial [Ooceraea biroi]